MRLNLALPGNGLTGTVVGAAFCGLLGNRVGGCATTDEDKRRAAMPLSVQALEAGPSGPPVAYGPDSGRYGNVVPGCRAYQANGESCRPFTDTVLH